MVSRCNLFDCMVDVVKGEMPGPIGMFRVPDDKGAALEYIIEYALNNALLVNVYKTYKNLLVPRVEGEDRTSEIDVLMVSDKGIFVLESKNYAGWIFGCADQRQWTASLNRYTKERFYNPIMQNRAHVKAVAAYLELPEGMFRSYIVFGERCELKQVPENTEEYHICQRRRLIKALRCDFRKRRTVLESDGLKDVTQRLDELAAGSSREARQTHIEQVQAAMRICPKCGKPLLERHRKSDGGLFIGCSGFPACRYIRDRW